MTFKIITDSTADLDENWAQTQDIDILGLTITLNDKTYPTAGPDRISSEELLQAMKDGGKPTTSQVNVGQFEASFRKYAKQSDQFFIWHFHRFFQGPISPARLLETWS